MESFIRIAVAAVIVVVFSRLVPYLVKRLGRLSPEKMEEICSAIEEVSIAGKKLKSVRGGPMIRDMSRTASLSDLTGISSRKLLKFREQMTPEMRHRIETVRAS